MPLDGRYRISRVIAPAASYDLVTLDEVKAALGLPPTNPSQDEALNRLISRTSAAINGYCDRVFVEQDYRDQFRALHNWLAPGDPVRVRQPPIALDAGGLPIATVTEDGAVVDTAAWEVNPTTGEFYRIDGATVTRWIGTTILIDYTGGYDPIPDDVKAATIQWIGLHYYGEYGRDPLLRSEAIPDLITQAWDTPSSLTQASIPAPIASLLNRYRIWSL